MTTKKIERVVVYYDDGTIEEVKGPVSIVQVPPAQASAYPDTIGERTIDEWDSWRPHE